MILNKTRANKLSQNIFLTNYKELLLRETKILQIQAEKK